MDAVFALDPEYMHIPGEDEIGFRCLAQRSRLADANKDNGVVSMFPPLAEKWLEQVQAQTPWKNFSCRRFRAIEREIRRELGGGAAARSCRDSIAPIKMLRCKFAACPEDNSADGRIQSGKSAFRGVAIGYNHKKLRRSQTMSTAQAVQAPVRLFPYEKWGSALSATGEAISR